METNVIWRCARAAVIELDDGGYFTTSDTWEVFVNDEPAGTTNLIETYVDGLVPGTRNVVRFVCGARELSVGVTTPDETFTIDVRDCGAKGDGEHDDTTNIQAAIMPCPERGRVLIPAGTYRIKSLFLKSGINIELAEGAQLLARATTAPRSPTSPVPLRARRATATPAAAWPRWAAGRARASRPTAPPLPASASTM